MKIKTVWEYSPEAEAKRILHTAHQMAVGFYRANNFHVLPYFNEYRLSQQVVLFPDLPYNEIPRFWEKVKQINTNVTPIEIDSKLALAMIYLVRNEELKKPDFVKTKKKWTRAQNSLLNEIFNIIPNKKGVIKKISIYPTSFGTTCSFSFIPNKNGQMYIYLREDQGISAITEAILTSLTRNEVYDDLDGNWSESELLVDWLLTKTAIANVLKKYDLNSNFVPTLRATRTKQSAKLLKESGEYYKKLGININQKVFDLKGENPLINEKTADNLTLTERLILKLLIEKANNVASFDDLGSLLFKSEDNFSLYAISKQIERLRNKLEENGISGSHIQTLRGQGYVLKN